MFVVGDDDNEVNEYTLQTAFDLSSNVSFKNTFSISQNINPAGIAFNDNGTRMFVVGFNNGSVNTYSLATGFDLSNGSGTAVTSVGSFNLANESTVPRALAFNEDGTVMYVTATFESNIIPFWQLRWDDRCS